MEKKKILYAIKRRKCETNWLLSRQTFLIDGMIAVQRFKLFQLNNIVYYESKTFIARTQCTHSHLQSKAHTLAHILLSCIHKKHTQSQIIHSLESKWTDFFCCCCCCCLGKSLVHKHVAHWKQWLNLLCIQLQIANCKYLQYGTQLSVSFFSINSLVVNAQSFI